MFFDEKQPFTVRKHSMSAHRNDVLVPLATTVILAAPALLLSAGVPLGPPSAIAAVVLWLAALGWGFHAMLQRRLAAEDRLARLESEVACERDARTAQLRTTRLCLLTLDTAWQHLDDSLRNGDIAHVAEGMRRVEDALLQLHETA